ncbi:MAG: hypothetical protein ACLFP2_03030 [Candidatus Woesearchaeota archaeon]
MRKELIIFCFIIIIPLYSSLIFGFSEQSKAEEDLTTEEKLQQGNVEEIDDWGSLSAEQLEHLPNFEDIPTDKVNDVIDNLPDNRKTELKKEQIAAVEPRSKLGDLGNYDLAEVKAGLGIPEDIDVHLDGGVFTFTDDNFVTAAIQIYDGDTFQELIQDIELDEDGFVVSNDNGEANMYEDPWTFSSDEGLMRYIASTMNNLGIQTSTGSAEITSDGRITISDDYTWHEVSSASHYQYNHVTFTNVNDLRNELGAITFTKGDGQATIATTTGEITTEFTNASDAYIFEDNIAIQESDAVEFTSDGVSYNIANARNISVNKSVFVRHADSIIVGDHVLAANVENTTIPFHYSYELFDVHVELPTFQEIKVAKSDLIKIKSYDFPNLVNSRFIFANESFIFANITTDQDTNYYVPTYKGDCFLSLDAYEQLELLTYNRSFFANTKDAIEAELPNEAILTFGQRIAAQTQIGQITLEAAGDMVAVYKGNRLVDVTKEYIPHDIHHTAQSDLIMKSPVFTAKDSKLYTTQTHIIDNQVSAIKTNHTPGFNLTLVTDETILIMKEADEKPAIDVVATPNEIRLGDNTTDAIFSIIDGTITYDTEHTISAYEEIDIPFEDKTLHMAENGKLTLKDYTSTDDGDLKRIILHEYKEFDYPISLSKGYAITPAHTTFRDESAFEFQEEDFILNNARLIFPNETVISTNIASGSTTKNGMQCAFIQYEGVYIRNSENLNDEFALKPDTYMHLCLRKNESEEFNATCSQCSVWDFVENKSILKSDVSYWRYPSKDDTIQSLALNKVYHGKKDTIARFNKTAINLTAPYIQDLAQTNLAWYYYRLFEMKDSSQVKRILKINTSYYADNPYKSYKSRFNPPLVMDNLQIIQKGNNIVKVHDPDILDLT